MAEKLEKDINKKEIIVLKQKKERMNLIQKVEKLEEMVSSLIAMNNLWFLKIFYFKIIYKLTKNNIY